MVFEIHSHSEGEMSAEKSASETHDKLRAVFLVYHGQGHFNGCFGLASAMMKNYHVVFAGHYSFEKDVTAQGFKFYRLSSIPFGTGLEWWFNQVQKKTFVYWHTLLDRWSNKLFTLREKELADLIATVQPDLILLDAQLATDFIALYPLLVRHEIAFAVLHTMLPTTLSNTVPPMTSLSFPEDKNIVETENKKVLRKQRWKSWIQRLVYGGASDEVIIGKSLTRNNVPGHFIEEKSSLRITLRHVPELILSPRGFDFKETVIKKHQYYLGLSLYLRNETHRHGLWEAYLAARNEIYGKMHAWKLKLIYCGLGSLSHESKKKVISLIKKLTTAIKDQPYCLVISANLNESELESFRTEKIFAFASVPQQELLSHCQLFITHGGFNSIKESIAYGAPMLVYPIQFKTDHPGNSARIVYHRLGLRGDAEKDSPEEIREKIETLLADSTFKENVMNLRATERKMDDRKLLSIVQKIPDFPKTLSQARDDQPT